METSKALPPMTRIAKYTLIDEVQQRSFVVMFASMENTTNSSRTSPAKATERGRAIASRKAGAARAGLGAFAPANLALVILLQACYTRLATAVSMPHVRTPEL